MVPLIISHNGAVHKDSVKGLKGFPPDIQVDWVWMAQNVQRNKNAILMLFFNLGSWISKAWRKEDSKDYDDE